MSKRTFRFSRVLATTSLFGLVAFATVSSRAETPLTGSGDTKMPPAVKVMETPLTGSGDTKMPPAATVNAT